MAEEFDPNFSADNLREVNLEGERLNTTLLGINQALSDAAKEASNLTQEAKAGYIASDSAAKSLSNKLASLTKDQLKGLKKNETFKRDVIKLEAESTARNAKIVSIQEQLNKAIEENTSESLKEADALTEVLIRLQDQDEAAQQIKKRYEQIIDTLDKARKINPFETLSTVLQQVPVLGTLFKGASSAAEKYNEVLVETNNQMKALSIASKGVMKSLSTGFLTFAANKAVKGIQEFSEGVAASQKALNIGAKSAEKLQNELIAVSQITPGLTANDLNESLRGVNESLGTTARFSDETLKTFTILTKKIGMSADEAGNLNKFSLATGQTLTEFTENATGTIKILNAQNKTAIDFKGILKDINSTSNAIKLSTRAQGYNLAEAAYQAKKMGLGMEKLDSIAGGLLDFEQSIAAELEAELLLGKDLNLEKARAAALDNDLVKMGQELQKQGITAGKFSRMNRIEQEAVAKAMGMSRDEMANMFVEQEALNKLGVDGAKNLDDAIEKKYAEIAAMEEGEAKQAALNKLKEESGNSSLVNQLRSQSLAEKQAEMMTKVGESMASAFSETGGFSLLNSTMDTLQDNIGKLATAIEMLSVAMLGIKLGRFLGKIGNVGGVFKGLGSKIKGFGLNLKNLGSKIKNIFSPKRFQLSAKQIQAGFGGKAAKDALAQGKSVRAANRIGYKAAKKAGTLGQGTKSSSKILSNLGKGAKLLKGAAGGIGSLLGGLALDYTANKKKNEAAEKRALAAQAITEEERQKLLAEAKAAETKGKGASIGSSTLTGAGIGATIGSIVPVVGTAVGGAVGGVLGAAIGTVQNYGDEIKSSMSQAFDFVGEKSSIIFEKLKERFSQFKDIILPYIQPTIDSIRKYFSQTFDTIFNFISNLFGDVKDLIINTFSNTFEFVINIIDGDFKAAFDNLKNIFSGIGIFIRDTIVNLISTGGNAILDLAEFFIDLGGLAIDAIKNLMSNLSEIIKNGFQFAFKSISTFLDDPIGNLKKGFTTAIDFIQEKFEILTNIVPDLFSKLKDKVLGFISPIGDTFSNLYDRASSIFGGGEEVAVNVQQQVNTSGDIANDFISRPNQPIQKFNKDDIIIGATSPFRQENTSNFDLKSIFSTLVNSISTLINKVSSIKVPSIDFNPMNTLIDKVSSIDFNPINTLISKIPPTPLDTNPLNSIIDKITSFPSIIGPEPPNITVNQNNEELVREMAAIKQLLQGLNERPIEVTSTVEVDGNKLGTAMGMGAYRIQ